MRHRLAFVVPRYGEQVLGGAEAITRQFAERLPSDRFTVEVLTTCAVDLQSWDNVLPEGISSLNGITVRRFPIAHQFRSGKRYTELMIKFNNRWPHTVDEEYEWIDNSAHSPALYRFVQRHHEAYDLLFFGPYLFGTTFYGMTLAPEKSILWPFIHDETYARFLQTRLMMQSAQGLLFNCEPELALAKGKLAIANPNMIVTGLGIDDATGCAQSFRETYGIMDPFIVYAGRLDSMKNILELVEYFRQFKLKYPSALKFVIIGKGPLTLPKHPDIIPLGFVDEQTKWDAFSAATVLIQPSLMESFSLVIMEAWQMHTPVMVHGDCDVTRYHVIQSNGGLYYSGYEEFAGALGWLLTHETERHQMGNLGRAYVRSRYNWPVVIERFTKAVEDWQS